MDTNFLRDGLVVLLSVVDKLVLELGRVLLVHGQIDTALDGARGRLEASLSVGLTVNVLALHTSEVASVAFRNHFENPNLPGICLRASVGTKP